MVDSWEIEIPALTGKKKRKAYIYLPVGYGESDKRYPVMYMFDGHNLFSDDEATYGKSWGLADYLDYTETQLIIAAVECNTVGNGRLSEYSPVDFTMHGGERIKGKGKKYMDWLTKTFKPFIDENFLTLPDRANTAIGGSSMGGLMTIYALAKYNKYFCGGAALSPSLWVGDNELPAFISNCSYGKNCVLFMDYGEKEFVNHLNQRQRFTKAFEVLTNKGVMVTARIVPNGTHSEASWEKEIPFFLPVLGF